MHYELLIVYNYYYSWLKYSSRGSKFFVSAENLLIFLEHSGCCCHPAATVATGFGFFVLQPGWGSAGGEAGGCNGCCLLPAALGTQPGCSTIVVHLTGGLEK